MQEEEKKNSSFHELKSVGTERSPHSSPPSSNQRLGPDPAPAPQQNPNIFSRIRQRILPYWQNNSGAILALIAIIVVIALFFGLKSTTQAELPLKLTPSIGNFDFYVFCPAIPEDFNIIQSNTDGNDDLRRRLQL